MQELNAFDIRQYSHTKEGTDQLDDKYLNPSFCKIVYLRCIVLTLYYQLQPCFLVLQLLVCFEKG